MSEEIVMQSKWLKTFFIVIGAITFSTLGIFASDSLQGIDRDLVGLAGKAAPGSCPGGMVPLKNENGVLCVDAYEATPSEQCPHKDPTNVLETEKNVGVADCYAASLAGAVPWTFVSLPQAQRLCANAGKRLPTSDEWYKFALGTDPATCVINRNGRNTTGSACASSIGAYDVVGNVWEWVDETVVGNTYAERPLPSEGYVTSVDASGVAITAAQAPDELYGSDYFWSKNEGVFGMIRGGFYGSDADAGLYAINASVSTAFSSQGVGFRCVEDVI